MADCLQMTHFHMGSQITNIRKVKDALNEAARIYAELYRLGAGLKYIDVGGGLGVDYDGSPDGLRVEHQLHAAGVRQRRGVPHQERVRRGRGAAPDHHLARAAGRWWRTTRCWCSTCWARTTSTTARPRPTLPDDAPEPIQDLFAIVQDLNKKNYLESYHDAVEQMEKTLALFNLGHLSLELRATAERLFWAFGRKLQRLVKELDHVPEELQDLDTMLSDTYFCNFSRVPEHAGLVGHRPAVPDHADPPADRGPDPAGGAGRHHLRLGRQDGPVHRPAGRAEHAGAAPVRRGRAVLPRGVPARGVPGDPRRPAQPVRRHERRPRARWSRTARRTWTR